MISLAAGFLQIEAEKTEWYPILKAVTPASLEDALNDARIEDAGENSCEYKLILKARPNEPDTPTISVMFYRGAGKVSVDIDSRQMGDLPGDATWEIVLGKKTGEAPGRKLVTSIPESRKASIHLSSDNAAPGEYEVRVRPQISPLSSQGGSHSLK